ncbi:hypothetical protein GCM10029978_068570 [Actinoallomurus acanthiterrae]
MKIWHDWEFIEDGRSIRSISVGMVAADDREYYAIFGNGPIDAAAAHPWLRANVLPHLPVDMPASGVAWRDRQHPDFAFVKDPSVIAAEILDFVCATPDPPSYGMVQRLRSCQPGMVVRTCESYARPHSDVDR